jgi:hypothetical protein
MNRPYSDPTSTVVEKRIATLVPLTVAPSFAYTCVIDGCEKRPSRADTFNTCAPIILPTPLVAALPARHSARVVDSFVNEIVVI